MASSSSARGNRGTIAAPPPAHRPASATMPPSPEGQGSLPGMSRPMGRNRDAAPARFQTRRPTSFAALGRAGAGALE